MSDDSRWSEPDGDGDSQFERLLREVAHAPAVNGLPWSPERLEAALGAHPRFRPLHRLGEGGFGTVFEVEDRRRGERVALKVLHRTDGQALYRFKREFRVLAGLRHANLVRLHELFAVGDLWFFTMERVVGTELVRHVLSAREPRERLGRLRGALAQLTGALAALHGAGVLHRDLKPANVLVTEEGRVVVLDFGLATRSAEHTAAPSLDAAGTPAYMAPERWRSAPPTAASDWYAVGVMLQEALVGALPPPPGAHPVRPLEPPPGAPADLAALCRALLEPEPTARPSGEEVARRLGLTQGPAPLEHDAPGTPPPLAEGFVGRAGELATLDAAFADAQRGTGVSVLVTGPSGMGKTALVERFLAGVRQREPRAALLVGRCHPRESVPFKTLDGVIDAASRYLRALPRAQAEALVPTDVLPLLRVFPVLRQVPAMAGARRRVLDTSDALELHRRAFLALRELLSRLAHQVPVVLCIDDLQWGDADSARPLVELLAPPDAPPLLLLGTLRDEESPLAPPLALLLGSRAAGGLEPRLLHLGALDAGASRALAQARGRTGAEAERIASEAGGHPLFIAELAHHLETGPARPAEAPERQGMVLHQMLAERAQRLPEPVRRLLEVLAIAAGPLERAVTRAAAGLSDEDEPEATTRLVQARLVRLTGGGLLDVYHDRVRQAVLARLDAPTRQEHHRRLALALAGTGAEPEALARHHLRAGDVREARHHLLSAARRAAELLAFERTAALYREVLALPHAGQEPAPAQVREWLGEVLVSAGRSAEAGEVFLQTAAEVPEGTALRLRAATEFLKSGRVDAGLATARHALAAWGLHLPTTARRARLDFLSQRARARWRGLRWRERAEAEVPARVLRCLDACWAVGPPLFTIDMPLASYLLHRHLRLALDAGEPRRVGRALAFEAATRALLGGGIEDALTLLARAETLLDAHGDAASRGDLFQLRSWVLSLGGRLSESLLQSERAEALMLTDFTRATRAVAVLRYQRQVSLFLLGRLRELARSYTDHVEDDRRRGDRFAEITLGAHLGWMGFILEDAPAAARALVDRLMEGWSQEGFHLQHFNAHMARVQIALYAGQGTAALEHLEALGPELRRSGLLRLEGLRFRVLSLSVRALLMSLTERGLSRGAPAEARRLLARVDTHLRALERCAVPWQRGVVLALRAGRSRALGQTAQALAGFTQAEECFVAGGVRVMALAARRMRGALLGGEQGLRLMSEVDALFRAEGARAPERMGALVF
jgi:eukaryotic-like serine/threonine-protein kinase